MHKCQFGDVNDVVCKVYLKYYQTPSTDHLVDHYNAFVTCSSDEPELNPAFHFIPSVKCTSDNTSDNSENSVIPHRVPSFDTNMSIINIPSPYRSKKKRNEETFLSMTLMSLLSVEKLDSIPYDINSNHLFSVKCLKYKWNDRQIDDRFFKMNPSERAGFIGL